MNLDGATWERIDFRTWALQYPDGSVRAVVTNRTERSDHRWQVIIAGTKAVCDRPGMDAAMQMAGEALSR